MAEQWRVEHDSMGEVRVPVDAKWGAQTQRAVQNFPISGRPIDRRLIRALALIKGEAARVNGRSKDVPNVDSRISRAIADAASEVADGEWDDQFPVDVFQTGSGTSSNMNMNEVLAHLASDALGEEVHPNDHVNASQSSNDVFPSAIHIAVTDATLREVVPALVGLSASLRRKQRAFRKVVKSGRTHLMDATPVTLGQEFGGYAAQIDEAIERLHDTAPRVGRLPLGGTAVGTGINAPKTFGRSVIKRLAERTGLPLTTRCQATGGRQVRTGSDYGEIYDHFACEFEYEDGSRMYSYCRHIPGCWDSVTEHAQGTKGTADISGSLIQVKGEQPWKYRGKRANPYQVEHDDLFASIRAGNPLNEGENGALSTMTAIFGRMATYSGKMLKWEDALNSKLSLAPAEYSWEATPPVPQVAVPGQTVVL
jgi:hypothetical protein